MEGDYISEMSRKIPNPPPPKEAIKPEPPLPPPPPPKRIIREDGRTKTKQVGNISVNYFSEEGRNLLDRIMIDWEEHLKGIKESVPHYEPSFYGFAYWLVRWSGLIEEKK